MMKTLILSIFLLAIFSNVQSQGYSIGDRAEDFKLLNIDGNHVSMSDYPEAKGIIVIFTCNHCPYAKKYEQRIIDLDKKYKSQGYPVIAINPNDPKVVAADSYDKMKERAREKGFTFPYLFDAKQKVYPVYGAKKTPHVYLLKKSGNDFHVAYIGAIDNNYSDADKVTEKYLENAIEALQENKNPDPAVTKAIGCSIKTRKK